MCLEFYIWTVGGNTSEVWVQTIPYYYYSTKKIETSYLILFVWLCRYTTVYW